MSLCGIYLLTNTVTGLRYVGQSRDIHKRWYMHSRGLCQMRLGRAIASYGWDVFKSEILELCPIEDLNSCEATWIEKLGTMTPNGYNLTSGGGQCSFFSNDTLAAMSKRRSGIPMSEKTKAKLSEIGRNRSPEYRQKIAEANSKRVISDETRAKLRAAKLNQSAETRAKIGEANKRRAGVKQSPEHIAKAKANRAAKRLLRQSATVSTTGDDLSKHSEGD